jgi:hypothetical protein
MFLDNDEFEDSFDDEEDEDMSSTKDYNEEESSASESAADPSQSGGATTPSYMHRPAKRYRFDNMPFPEFSSAVEVTDSSSDEESVQQRDEQYRTKEDEDVEVFLNLTKRMSLQSLLHLLQGAARAQNNITDTSDSHPMMEYSVLLSGSRRSSRSPNTTAVAPPGIVKQKKFRFAEISENRVREVVHPIESYKDIPGLWWTNEQMNEIRTDEIRVVKHFRKYRPQFIHSVESLVRANESPAVLEQHMRHLIEESFARGLETHSVLCIRERRKSHIAAVLQEQQDCREAGDSYELASHCIREQSIAYSQQLSAFAFRMAKCDHIEALKATMSAWSTPEGGACA